MADKDPVKPASELAEPNKTLIDLENLEEAENVLDKIYLKITSPLSDCFDDLTSAEAQKIIDESKIPNPELENLALIPTLVKLRKSMGVDYSYIAEAF